MENVLFTFLLAMSISFNASTSDLKSFKGNNFVETEVNAERAIHPCDGAWILYYRHARYDCGYTIPQSQAYANQQVALCHQNMQ